MPTHPDFKPSFSDEEDYELFGDLGKGSEPPLDSKSMERPTTSKSISGSASSSNGSEEQVYGDFFGNLGDSRSLHHLSPTQSSSSNYAAGNGVSGDSFNCFGTSTTAPLSPFAFPRDSRKNHSDAANSPTFDSASSSSSSLRHTHLPLPAAPPHSPSVGYFGTPPQSPTLGFSSPTRFSSSSQTQAKTSNHFGKAVRFDEDSNTWVKSYLDSIGVDSSIPDAIKEVYREYRELQKLADFYSTHDVKVLTADLNSDLKFVQENLPEELSNEEQKVAIKSLLMKLPELWAEGYFIIPDIKSDNIRAKIEEDGTKQAYLFDAHFTQKAIGEDARDIAIQFLSVLQTNLHNKHLTTADFKDILKQFQALKQSGNLETKLSNAIQTERENHSFDTFCHTHTNAIETCRIYETEKYRFKLNGEATIIDHQKGLSAFNIIAELEDVINDLIQSK